MIRVTPRQRLGAIPAVAALPRNAVLHGDCIDILQTCPEAFADFILTDPPYLCNYVDSRGRSIANDNDPRWVAPAFAEAFRVLKDDALCVSFYGWKATDTFMSAWRAAGFRPVGHLVFPKTYASGARFAEYRHECAYLLAKGRPPLPSTPLTDVLPWAHTGNRLHPTQKPKEALTPLIEAFCPAQGLVLDPFCGSGSTLAAAKACGRDWLGIELDARYVATARCRLEEKVRSADRL